MTQVRNESVPANGRSGWSILEGNEIGHDSSVWNAELLFKLWF